MITSLLRSSLRINIKIGAAGLTAAFTIFIARDRQGYRGIARATFWTGIAVRFEGLEEGKTIKIEMAVSAPGRTQGHMIYLNYNRVGTEDCGYALLLAGDNTFYHSLNYLASSRFMILAHLLKLLPERARHYNFSGKILLGLVGLHMSSQGLIIIPGPAADYALPDLLYLAHRGFPCTGNSIALGYSIVTSARFNSVFSRVDGVAMVRSSLPEG